MAVIMGVSFLNLQFLNVHSLSNFTSSASSLSSPLRGRVNSNIQVFVDENQLNHQNHPIIIVDGNTFAPLRELAFGLGVLNDSRHIIWNGSQQTVMVKRDQIDVEFQIHNRTAFINGGSHRLVVTPFIHNGRTYVPLKFVAEAFSYQPTWNPSSQTIHIRNSKGIVDTKNNQQESLPQSGNRSQEIVNEILSNEELRKFLTNEVVDAFSGYSGYASPATSTTNNGSYIRGTYDTTSGGYTSSGYLNYAGRYYYYYGGSQYEIDFYKKQLGGSWGLAPDGVTLYYNNVLYKLAR